MPPPLLAHPPVSAVWLAAGEGKVTRGKDLYDMTIVISCSEAAALQGVAVEVDGDGDVRDFEVFVSAIGERDVVAQCDCGVVDHHRTSQFAFIADQLCPGHLSEGEEGEEDD